MRLALTCILLLDTLWTIPVFQPGLSPNFSVVPHSPPVVMSYTEASTAGSARAVRIAAEPNEAIIRISLPRSITNHTTLVLRAKTDTQADIQYALGTDQSIGGFESIEHYLPNGLGQTWKEATIPLLQTGTTLYLKLIPNHNYRKLVVYLDRIDLVTPSLQSGTQPRIINTTPIISKTIRGVRYFYPFCLGSPCNTASYTAVAFSLKSQEDLDLRSALVYADDQAYEQKKTALPPNVDNHRTIRKQADHGHDADRPP